MKGSIRASFEIWCGTCSFWERLEAPTADRACAEAVKFGWRHTEEHGWVCPSGVDRLAEPPKPVKLPRPKKPFRPETWTSASGLVWNKVERKILPRYERGSDFESTRPLLLDAGFAKRLWWWPGVTSWIALCQTGYHGSKLEVESVSEYREDDARTDTVFEGGRLSVDRLNAADVRAKIADKLGFAEADLPKLDPKATWLLEGVK